MTFTYCITCRLLLTGLDDERKADRSSLLQDCGVVYRTISRSPCSTKVHSNTTAAQSKPTVYLRPGGGNVERTGANGGRGVGRDGTEDSNRRDIGNVLMDVDDFEHEVTVA